jgi:ADP-heptose:LPS heptosyltransferase/tetratricopeptide (TPR) repeat protein
MATSQSKGHLERFGRKVAFGNGRYVEWSEVFTGNPNIAHPIEVAQGTPVDWIHNYGGCRPYVNYAISSHKRQYYTNWKVSPGELYLSEEEKESARRAVRGVSLDEYVVVGPHTKNDSGGNKNWYIDRWEQVIAAIELPVVQLGLPGQKILRGATYIPTSSFRAACAIISGSAALLGTEGALHHAAGALSIPAVVLFGGFIHPHTTGYDFHRNIVKGDEPCGRRTFCAHCRAAMSAIAAQEVLAELEGLLPGVVGNSATWLRSRPPSWRDRPLHDLRSEIKDALPGFDFSTIIECGEIIRRQKASKPQELTLLAAAYSAAGAPKLAEQILAEIPTEARSTITVGRLLMTIKQQQNLHSEAAKFGASLARIGSADSLMYLQIGRSFEMAGCPDQSLSHYRAAVSADPDNLDANADYARTLFLHGKFKEATPFIAATRSNKHFQYFSGGLKLALLKDELSRYSEFMLWPIEAGLGSQVLFLTIYEDLLTLYPNTVIACDSRLLSLFRKARPKTRFVDELTAIGMAASFKFIAHTTPLCVLPRLRPDVNHFRPATKVLEVPSVARQLRSKYLDGRRSLVVGISWFGGIAEADKLSRSIPLVEWGPILTTRDVTFLSLQFDHRKRGYLIYGDRFSVTSEVEIARRKYNAKIIIDNGDDTIEHLLAQIGACDMVISVDNATASFAGALGAPTLLVTSAAPAWPLQLHGSKSIWFDSVTLIRQQTVGSWRSAIMRAANILRSSLPSK